MHLPSHVPRYDEVPLVAFDFLEPRFVRPDVTHRLRAWVKVAEVERRLDEFEWLVHVARKPQGIELFVLDLATAYLLSLESAIQVLQAERFPKGIERWLKPILANDLTFRGLRTLRHLEAHVRAGGMTQRYTGGHSRFTGGEGGSNVGWRWAPISMQELRTLHSPRISEVELPDWNQHLEDMLTMDLMRDGLTQLVKVVEAAEASP